QSELDRLGRAATLEDAEKLADKAGQAARTHWFDVTNGTQRGWAFRSAEGRGDGPSQKGAPARGRGGGGAKAGDRHMFIQNGGPAAGTTYYKESGPAVSLDGKFQASITEYSSANLGRYADGTSNPLGDHYYRNPQGSTSATAATEGKNKAGVEVGQWG